MEVVVCAEPGVLVRGARARPSREPGQVLVRIRRVGMCGTDYHIFRGTQPYVDYPRVIGHELAGEVVEADDEGRFAIGTTVCIMPYISCGTCAACRKGKTNCCMRIEVLGVHRDGGLAEYLAVDARFVIDAQGLSLDQAAMVEFLSIGRHAAERAGLSAGQKVLVSGAGPIGMAVTLFAVRAGAEVTVIDGNAARATFCAQTLGARAALVLDDGVGDRLRETSGGDGFDTVFDATGSAAAIEAGFEHVAHGGNYVLVSVVPDTIRFSDPEFHRREMSLLGSRNATLADFAAVIEAIRAGEVPTTAMHTHSAPLSELPGRMAEWMTPGAGVIKAIVEI
ncbi:MAG: zinc-binding alcohol dehydrogenase family protein [Sphingomonas sp.]|nr:zinc-binding alcohol dehydrogenase family protein [Sphingomonas sp.]